MNQTEKAFSLEDFRDAIFGITTPELEAIISIVLNQAPFRQAPTVEGVILRRDHLLVVLKALLGRHMLEEKRRQDGAAPQ